MPEKKDLPACQVMLYGGPPLPAKKKNKNKNKIKNENE